MKRGGVEGLSGLSNLKIEPIASLDGRQAWLLQCRVAFNLGATPTNEKKAGAITYPGDGQLDGIERRTKG